MPAALTFPQFQRAVGTGRIEPVYLLQGEEPYFHDEAIRILRAAAAGAGEADLNTTAFAGPETTLDRVLEAASTYPMGGRLRLVIVRRAAALECGDPAALRAWLERPNPRACLVFSDPAFDRRRTLARTLEAGACRVDCAPLDEARAVDWVRARLRGLGIGCAEELAAAIVAGLSGHGLGPLAAELDKLALSLGAPRPLSASDLSILAGIPPVEESFEVGALALRGRRGEAIAALRGLLRSGADPVYLLGGIAAQVRGTLRAALAQRRRLSPRDAAAIYGLEPWRYERFGREAAGMPPARLTRALALCLRADRELKGLGVKDPAHALERLVHGIAAPGGAAR